jgi:hypothetical protein
MGTRSLTVFEEEDGTRIACVYRQMDGYPNGQGKDLKDVVGKRCLCNGYGMGTDGALFSNGMGCLAATVIAGLKCGIGDFYMMAVPDGKGDENFIEKDEIGEIGCAGSEYIYVLSPREVTTRKVGKIQRDDLRGVNLRVYATSKYGRGTIYNGPIDKFNPMKVEKEAFKASDAAYKKAKKA